MWVKRLLLLALPDPNIDRVVGHVWTCLNALSWGGLRGRFFQRVNVTSKYIKHHQIWVNPNLNPLNPLHPILNVAFARFSVGGGGKGAGVLKLYLEKRSVRKDKPNNLTVVAKLFLLAVATPTNRLLLACALWLSWMVWSQPKLRSFIFQSRLRALLLRCDNKWPSRHFPTITCSITQGLDMLSLPSCHTSMANLASDSRRDCGRWRAQEGSRWVFGLTHSAAQVSLCIQTQSENHFSLHWTLGISHQPWLATLNGKIQGKWKVPGRCNERIPTRHQIWRVSEVTWDTFYAVPIFCAHFLHNKQVVEWQAGQKISSAENGGFVSNTSKGGTGSNNRHASKHQTSRN